MDTSDILSFCLCTNSENGQMYGTRQLEKNHMHTETERMINFIFSKNHYVTNPVHGLEFSSVCYTKFLQDIKLQWQRSIPLEWTKRQTTLHPHLTINITNVKSLAGNWKSMCHFTQYNCTVFPISVFYAL